MALSFLIVGPMVCMSAFGYFAGFSAITQPLATIFAAIVVPSIGVLAYLVQKRVEHSYEMAREARSVSREFIDASTKYQIELLSGDSAGQLNALKEYQSNWFRLQTALSTKQKELISDSLAVHWEGLRDLQVLRHNMMSGREIEDKLQKKVIERLQTSETILVENLAQISQSETASRDQEADFLRANVARYSRGNILIQGNSYLTKEEIARFEKNLKAETREPNSEIVKRLKEK